MMKRKKSFGSSFFFCVKINEKLGKNGEKYPNVMKILECDEKTRFTPYLLNICLYCYTMVVTNIGYYALF